jgi:tartrate dehydratase alpha subunit/fumarate hydratase class I-like protein
MEVISSMRNIEVNTIIDAVSQMCMEANYFLNDDIKKAMQKGIQNEKSPIGTEILDKLITNAELAAKKKVAICQDTGMAVVFVTIGQEVHISGGGLADAINEEIEHQGEYVFGRHSKTEKRKQNEIGIHAVRGGSIVGEHQTMFAGPGEIIEINHTALSRDVFAYGAVRAAKFMVGQKSGFYTMKNVIE